MHVYDSSAIIELLEGTPKGELIAKELSHTLVRITPITVHEILAGAKDDLHQELLKSLLETFSILRFGFEEADVSAKIERSLSKEKKKINDADLFIAAICFQNDATLVTCDRDFRKIDGLDVMFF